MNDNKEASYKIQCEESYITVKELMMRSTPQENEIKIPHSSSDYSSKNYQEVQRSLTEAGFTNVSTKAVYDIYWGITEVGSVSSVSINGCKKFSKNDIFHENDDPDVIAAKKEEEKKRKDEEERKKEEEKRKEKEEIKKRYEESIQLNKIKESLEKNAPKEMAMRAIVVAMTYGQAMDVFKNDGCTYDIKKFHTYNELGDFFLSVRYEGNWTVYNETTWKVEKMILAMHDHQARIKIDCYITRVNDEYKLLKVKKVIAAEDYLYSEDPSKTNIEYIDESDKTNCPFLTVPLKLIEKGRK